MNEKTRSKALAIILGLAVAFSWFKPLDMSAISQVDAGLKRALITFAVARTLNAVISVLQGTEVSVQVGVGATLAPGQILDPVNDLVEQFGDLMLAASVGFGIMHILIKIGSFWLFSLLLTISASGWLWMRWKNMAVPEWLAKAVIVLLFVRFSIPVVMIANDFAFKQFMEPEYNQSINVIKLSAEDINKSRDEIFQDNAKPNNGVGESSENKQVAPELSQTMPQDTAVAASNEDIQAESGVAELPPPQEAVVAPPPQAPVIQSQKPGFISRAVSIVKVVIKSAVNIPRVVAHIPRALSNAKHLFEMKLEKFRQLADQLVDHVINLIVIFIMQTIIIPIVFLWVVYRLGVSSFNSIGASYKAKRELTSVLQPQPPKGEIA